MIDTHLHIGQFYETWYDPLMVLDIVTGEGVTDAIYTSTTSGKDGVLYAEVEREIALVAARHDPQKIRPYLWYNPGYARQGLSTEKTLAALPYKGIKIHPRAHLWNLADRKTFDLADSIFSLAAEKNLPVLIHTGYDPLDEAQKFEIFFKSYPGARVILAHCRPLDQTIGLLHKYPNVLCDTAFVPEEDLLAIAEAGFGGRVLPGSDFPITHYFNPVKNKISLTEQYKADAERLQNYGPAGLCLR
jgi:predicted TIM-barrel fold metal-dependent hydrolase